MTQGYIYVLSNPSFIDEVIKIGRSFSDPEKRCSELFTTGVPTPFNIEFKLYVNNVILLENKVHNILDIYRIYSKREFFKIDKNEAIEKDDNKGLKYDNSFKISITNFGVETSKIYQIILKYVNDPNKRFN